ncbi:hypothetical protein GIB67_029857 [Kingdonia uniflora]|uniref:Uncharacterized protein n=1 Tax=Kingdonia uniflora TaxID=39325 RepID=A0A7J7NJ21_9MAGN|nr:hypothetical protein GIB67_029857 [Kingdonia uniflora]
MDFDDWDFSAEEIDSFERDALKKIAERKSSSTTASISSSSQELLDNKVKVPLSQENQSVKEMSKVFLKLFLHASGNIAAKFQYHQVLHNLS